MSVTRNLFRAFAGVARTCSKTTGGAGVEGVVAPVEIMCSSLWSRADSSNPRIALESLYDLGVGLKTYRDWAQLGYFEACLEPIASLEELYKPLGGLSWIRVHREGGLYKFLVPSGLCEGLKWPRPYGSVKSSASGGGAFSEEYVNCTAGGMDLQACLASTWGKTTLYRRCSAAKASRPNDGGAVAISLSIARCFPQAGAPTLFESN